LCQEPAFLESLTAVFTILYIFWPLIILFGVKALFRKQIVFFVRLKMSFVQIFIAWVVWAFFLVFIYLHDQKPILIMPGQLDHFLFGLLGLVTGTVTITWLYRTFRDRRNRLFETRQLEDLLALTPDQFERLIKELFEVHGYQTELSGGNGDHGVDVIVHNDEGEKWIVQCKRYSGSVGEPVVRDLYGTMLHEEAQRAYLITTGSFTAQAKAWAEEKPIVLYDGDALIKLIQRTQKRAKQALV